MKKLGKFFFKYLVSIFILILAAGSAEGRSDDRVLFIGDSHSVGAFGDGVRSGLFESGIAKESNFYQIAVTGSNATQWFYGRLRDLSIEWTLKLPGKPKLHKTGRVRKGYDGISVVIAQVHPTRVIVELGTNDLFQYYETVNPGAFKRARAEKATSSREPASITPMDPLPPELQHDPMGRPIFSVRKLLTAKSMGTCTFILPPEVSTKLIPHADQDRFFTRLKDEAIRDHCSVVDSREIKDGSDSTLVKNWKDCKAVDATSPRLTADYKDGIHFLQNKGEYWGRCAALALAQEVKSLDP